MLRNKYFIVIIFLMLASVGAYNFWFFYFKRRVPTNNNNQLNTVDESGVNPSLVEQEEAKLEEKTTSKSPESSLTSLEQDQGKDTGNAEEINWGGDPFGHEDKPSSLNTIRDEIDSNKTDTLPDKNVDAQPNSKHYEVTAILISDLRKVAIINNKIVQEGDKFDDIVVKRIIPSAVELINEQGKSSILKIKDKAGYLPQGAGGDSKLDNISTDKGLGVRD